MVNIGIGTAALAAVLGYGVVFFGIILLMAVITVAGKFMKTADLPAKLPAAASVSGAKTVCHTGIDPKKVAAITAAIAEYEGEAL